MTFLFPWNILVFFISFSLISFSLEKSGFFNWCAFKAIRLAKNDTLKLFNYLFVLVSILTFFTSNDIVILTLTPLFLHFKFVNNKYPRLYVFMLFFVANTGSFGLLLGNLTNILFADATNMVFLNFLKVLFVPMLFSLLIEYILLRFIFSKEINLNLTNKHLISQKLIKDSKEMYLSLFSIILVICMAITESIHGLPLWSYSLTISIILLLTVKYDVYVLLKNLPYKILLFVSILFVLVNFINLSFIATTINYFFANSSPILFIVIFCSIVGSSFLSAFFNNLPATILMSSLLPKLFLGTTTSAVTYSMIIGSNIGANLMIGGSLAGLMWFNLIKKAGYNITWMEFSKLGFMIMVPVIFVVSLVLSLII